MRRKIGLYDVDGSNFPSVPLMKLSSHHTYIGDAVEIAQEDKFYDIAYFSKVFSYSEEKLNIKANNVIRGGTGYDLKNKLSCEIENIYPDYNLYGIHDTAYGFLTRGCPGNCEFCIVSEKEGLISNKVSDLKNFWDGQKEIKLLDPNLLACKDRVELLHQLVDSRARIDFTQGLDIRFMNPEIIEIILKLKIETIHFAWDKAIDLTEHFRTFKEISGLSARKCAVYVLTNFNTTLEQDLHRIDVLRTLGYEPYTMIYDKHLLPRRHVLKSLQRWTNNKKSGFWRKYNTLQEFQSGEYVNEVW